MKQARVSSSIYFARPDSFLWREASVEVRLKLGRALAAQNTQEADIVIGVPDSGLPLAQGFSEASRIPLKLDLSGTGTPGVLLLNPKGFT